MSAVLRCRKRPREDLKTVELTQAADRLPRRYPFVDGCLCLFQQGRGLYPHGTHSSQLGAYGLPDEVVSREQPEVRDEKIVDIWEFVGRRTEAEFVN